MSSTTDLRKVRPVKWLTVTAMLMALNIAMSSFSIPVPGGHLYLNDVVICTAAILLDPLGAFIVGGVGAFLGDFFFYPAPMFVSLLTHGLQAVVVSLCAHKLFMNRRSRGALVGVHQRGGLLHWPCLCVRYPGGRHVEIPVSGLSGILWRGGVHVAVLQSGHAEILG